MRVAVAGSGRSAKSLRWKSNYWQLCNRSELCCQCCIWGNTHTHSKQTPFYTNTNRRSKQDRFSSCSLLSLTRKEQLFGDNYQGRLMGTRFHCYGTPWHWSQFPRTGRRNRWPQNAPHWSSEIRRPWRLSYRPPFQGRGRKREESRDIRGMIGEKGRESYSLLIHPSIHLDPFPAFFPKVHSSCHRVIRWSTPSIVRVEKMSSLG